MNNGRVVAKAEPWREDSTLAPSPWALYKFRKAKRRRTTKGRTNKQEPEAPTFARRTDLASTHTTTSHLESLPTELLQYILHHRLPTGMVFHVSPTQSGERRLLSVHCISSAYDEESLFGSLRTLSLVSQRVKNMAFHVFYGQNRFVFEIAAQPLLSRVQVRDGGDRPPAGYRCISNSKPPGWLAEPKVTWGTVVTLDESAPSMTAPFGAVAMSYMRDIVLMISLTPDLGLGIDAGVDWGYLSDRLTEFTKAVLVRRQPRPALQTLMVNVGLAKRWSPRKHHLSDLLVVRGREHLNVGFQQETNPEALELAVECRGRLEEMLHPLQRLRGLRDARVGGLVHDEFAAELENRLTKPADEVVEFESEDEAAASKPASKIPAPKRKRESDGGSGRRPSKRLMGAAAVE